MSDAHLDTPDDSAALALRARARAALQAAAAAGNTHVIFHGLGVRLILTTAPTADGVHVQLEVDTPVASFSLLDVTLSPTHPKTCAGVDAHGIKVQACIELDTKHPAVEVTYDIKVPLLGEKKGSATVKL